MDKVTIYRVLWPTLKLDATNRHGLADVITLEDHKRALDAARADNRTYINERHEHMKTIEELTSQLATLQAQLRRVEGERNTARHRVDALEAREIDVEILQGDLTTLRQLVEVHTKQLTELTIIPIGCSREQELRWTQSIKDLRATLAAQDVGKEDVSHE